MKSTEELQEATSEKSDYLLKIKLFSCASDLTFVQVHTCLLAYRWLHPLTNCTFEPYQIGHKKLAK